MNLTSSDLQKMSCLSRRSIARLAAAGKIPGAFRGDGLHFTFAPSPKLESWCKFQKGRVGARKLPKVNINARDKSRHLVTIEAVNSNFLHWERKVSEEIDSWDHAKRNRAMKLLAPMVQMWFRLHDADKSHREQVSNAMMKMLDGMAD